MIKNKLYCYKFYLLLISTLLNFQSLFSQGNPNPNALIDSLILNEMTDKNLPGLSTVIVKNGGIVWAESYGYADEKITGIDVLGNWQ
jgi:CubicO group peptidase (beta-lactamase class C family)